MDGTMTSTQTRIGHTYRTLDVPVAGGDLRVAVWDPDPAAAAAPDVLLIHGVTSSHLAWPFVVDRLPGVRAVAPDLRGRGASNEVSGPAGMRAHADDLAAALDALGIARTVVVGHSMGAFVAVVFAHVYPERVSRLVLVDGGLPLDVPAGLDTDALVAGILGPTAARLSMRFADVGEYLEFWRGHPAFRADWTPELEDYLAYDLVDDGAGSLRPATSYATTADDSASGALPLASIAFSTGHSCVIRTSSVAAALAEASTLASVALPYRASSPLSMSTRWMPPSLPNRSSPAGKSRAIPVRVRDRRGSRPARRCSGRPLGR